VVTKWPFLDHDTADPILELLGEIEAAGEQILQQFQSCGLVNRPPGFGAVSKSTAKKLITLVAQELRSQATTDSQLLQQTLILHTLILARDYLVDEGIASTQQHIEDILTNTQINRQLKGNLTGLQEHLRRKKKEVECGLFVSHPKFLYLIALLQDLLQTSKESFKCLVTTCTSKAVHEIGSLIKSQISIRVASVTDSKKLNEVMSADLIIVPVGLVGASFYDLASFSHIFELSNTGFLFDHWLGS